MSSYDFHQELATLRTLPPGFQLLLYMDLGESVADCKDDWNSLDHFNPTTDSMRIFACMFCLPSVYAALQDDWNLVEWVGWTYEGL